MVLAKESGYTVTPFDSTNIYTWEIGYKDKDGQERSILLSNFKDRSMEHPFGYCIEKNFQTMTGEVYARDVISPVIPAVCWQPEYWIRFLNYYVSGDHITDRPYKDPATDISPRAEVALKTSPCWMNLTAAWIGKIQNQIFVCMILIMPVSSKGSRTSGI